VNLFQPSVTIDKDGPELGVLGAPVTYDYTITNTSSPDSPNLILDTLIDSGDNNGGAGLGDLTGYGTYNSACDNLAPGVSCSFSIVYVIQVGDDNPLDNTVEVHYHPFGFLNDISDSDDHSIEVLPPSAVTDSATPHCQFDVDDELDGNQFRLLFTPDLKNWPAYKLAASNPGQFFYNIFDGGAANGTTTLTVEIPYPFVFKGAMPIHIYHNVDVTEQGELLCFLPLDEFEARAGEITWGPDDTYGNTQEITIPNVQLSPQGFVYVNLHLDYFLKGTTDYGRNSMDDAVDHETGLDVLIPNGAGYTFSYHNGVGDSDTVYSINEFKKIPGVAGFVIGEDGVTLLSGVSVRLVIPLEVKGVGGTEILTTTDDDGWYMIEYKHKGKPTDYEVVLEVGLNTYTKVVQLKGNAFTYAHFNLLVDPPD
jgi:hypothetical protein